MNGMLEVCIDRVDAIDACVRGGADCVELCASLDIGGVTPSRGTMRELRDASLPVHVLIRPRDGDFVYGQRDARVMLDDIAAVADAGLAGVVIGAATADGVLDMALMERLMRAAEGLQTTLHRVVDTVIDPLLAVDRAVGLGMGRVLSSGGQARAIDGRTMLGKMVNRTDGRSRVMAGGGLDHRHVGMLSSGFGVDAFHGSCRRSEPADPVLGQLGFCADEVLVCEASRVAALRAAIDRGAA